MPITPDDLDDALTVTEAATMLRITYRHMHRLLASGEIEHLRVGVGPRARVLITRRQMTEYLNMKKAGHTPKPKPRKKVS